MTKFISVLQAYRVYPMSESTVLTTPNQIELFHLLQIKYALQIEIRTGLRHSRGSVLKVAQAKLEREGIKPKGRKATVAKQIDDLIAAKGANL